MWEVSEENPLVLDHYLLAGLFTGDLDILAHFFEHQGASAKWLCLWFLANQDFLEETFKLEGKAPRFQKRQGKNSLWRSFENYQKNTAFHGFKKDKKPGISACKICKRRLPQFAAPINSHGVHKKHAGKEMNK